MISTGVVVSTIVVVIDSAVVNMLSGNVVIDSDVPIINCDEVARFSEDNVSISVVILIDSNVQVYQVIFAIFIVFNIFIPNFKDILLSHSWIE
jgi:hypothetical protein